MSGDSVAAAYPLFPEEGDGSIPISPLQIRPISHKLAKAFVEHWHYSKKIPTGKNIEFGLYDDALYAVIVYGVGVNPYQAQSLKVKSVIEIKRMCRREPKLSYPLSRFIRLTQRMVHRIYPHDAVVAFADQEQGHAGTVYKAAGFQYCGLTNPEWHLVDANGMKRHRRYAFRKSRRAGITIAEAREQLGVQRVKTLPKHRWVLSTKDKP